jgi:hypothetical protein
MNGPRLAAVLGLLAITSCAFALDTYPPPWRGDEGTTFQTWEFDTDTNPVDPSPVANPYGTPSAQVAGNFPFTAWIPQDNGYQGVWKFEDYILLDLPNNPVANDYKEIWIQLTYYADEAADPEIVTSPTAAGAVQTIEKTELALQPGAQVTYWHATYQITLEPNPASEQVWIMPRDCTLFVDEIVVDTICAPEPASFVLLTLAGLFIRRR